MTLSEKLRELIAATQQIAAGAPWWQYRNLIRDHGPELLRALEDAERWRHIKRRYLVFKADPNGQHQWRYRGSPRLLRGVTIDAAVDDAIDQARQS